MSLQLLDSPDATAARQPPALALESYLPYRLGLLSNLVSRALARMYEERFNLSVGEWRVMSILARYGPLSAIGVSERSGMDKVQVSRAVAKAVDAGMIHRTIDRVDRRRSVLTLTTEGRTIHDRIVPLALEIEDHLKQALSTEESAMLGDMLSRLLVRAHSLKLADYAE